MNSALPRGPRADRPVPPGFFSTEQDGAREAMQSGEIKSYAEIRALIASRFKGRIIGVDLDQTGRSSRSWVYHVRLLPENGNVLLISARAYDGAILSVKGRQ